MFDNPFLHESLFEETNSLNETDFLTENDISIQTFCAEHAINLDSLESLAEQKNIIRFNRQSKIAALQGHAANIIAKEKHDRLFDKMMFYRTKYKQFKAMIQKKYGPLALKRAKMAFRTGKLVNKLASKVEPTSERKF
jgi:hypothetical protein